MEVNQLIEFLKEQLDLFEEIQDDIDRYVVRNLEGEEGLVGNDIGDEITEFNQSLYSVWNAMTEKIKTMEVK